MDRRLFVALALAAVTAAAGGSVAMARTSPSIRLPEPRLEGRVSVERALKARRSVRAFQTAPLTLGEISQLLWAAQGVTGSAGHRTAPSAGALYPLTLYLAVGKVSGLQPGVYRYDPADHSLVRTGEGDRRALVGAAAGQDWLEQAAAIVVISANPTRTTARYGARGQRYVHIEAGHAAENLSLQAAALGLGVTDVGTFDDAKVKRVMGLAAAEAPVLLLPIGRPRS